MSIAKRLGSLIAELPLSESERNAYHMKIHKHATACGCTEGGVTAFVAILGYTLWLFFHFDGNFVLSAIKCVAVLIVGGFAGKLAGLAVAKLKLLVLFWSLSFKHH